MPRATRSPPRRTRRPPVKARGIPGPQSPAPSLANVGHVPEQWQPGGERLTDHSAYQNSRPTPNGRTSGAAEKSTERPEARPLFSRALIKPSGPTSPGKADARWPGRVARPAVGGLAHPVFSASQPLGGGGNRAQPSEPRRSWPAWRPRSTPSAGRARPLSGPGLAPHAREAHLVPDWVRSCLAVGSTRSRPFVRGRRAGSPRCRGSVRFRC